MRLWIAFAPLMFTAAASAATVSLYNGALGTSPQSQGELFYLSVPGTGTETVGSSSTTYDSSANLSEHGGFSNYTFLGTLVDSSFPSLNRTTGFSVDLSLQKVSENHGNDNDRSGCSLIVLASDHVGVELEFWNNEVWAQSGSGFTHAEGVAYNTTTALTAYHLAVSGSTYTLSINGMPSLSGNLHDYSSAGSPYTIPNYLFLGDDTGSAAGAFTFSSFSVTTPEPGALALVSGAAIVLRRTGRKRPG